MENNIEYINENVERCQLELENANIELSELVDKDIDDEQLESSCNEIMSRIERITGELNSFVSLL